MVSLVSAIKNRRNRSSTKAELSTIITASADKPLPSPKVAPLRATTGPSKLRSVISSSKTPSPVSPAVRELEVCLCPMDDWYMSSRTSEPTAPSTSRSAPVSRRPTYMARFTPATPQLGSSLETIPGSAPVTPNDVQIPDPLASVCFPESTPVAMPSPRPSPAFDNSDDTLDPLDTPASRHPSPGTSSSSRISMTESVQAACLRAPMLGTLERFDAAAFCFPGQDVRRGSAFSFCTGSSFAGDGDEAGEPHSPFFFAADRRVSAWSAGSYGSSGPASLGTSLESARQVMFLDVFSGPGSPVSRASGSSLLCAPPPASARLARRRPTPLYPLGSVSRGRHNSLVSTSPSPRAVPSSRRRLSAAGTGPSSGGTSPWADRNFPKSTFSMPRSATSERRGSSRSDENLAQGVSALGLCNESRRGSVRRGGDVVRAEERPKMIRFASAA